MTQGHHEHKANTMIIGIASIIAIVLIVIMTISYNTNVNTYNYDLNSDSSGQVSEIIQLSDIESSEFCKIIVGKTTIYDDTTLAVILSPGETTYYSGYTVSIISENSEGCVVDVNGNQEYLAVGQIQRLGNLYVTVTDVVLN